MCYVCDWFFVEAKLWGKERLVTYRREAVVDRKGVVQLEPLLGMPHIGQIEAVIAYVFYPCEAHFKGRRNRIGARRGIGAAEIEIAAVPLSPNIDEIVELGIFWRRLNMRRFEVLGDQRLRFCIELGLDRSRNCWLGWFRWAIHPLLACFCH